MPTAIVRVKETRGSSNDLHDAVTLLDSGATMSFVSREWATKANLTLVKGRRLRLRGVNASTTFEHYVHITISSRIQGNKEGCELIIAGVIDDIGTTRGITLSPDDVFRKEEQMADDMPSGRRKIDLLLGQDALFWVYANSTSVLVGISVLLQETALGIVVSGVYSPDDTDFLRMMKADVDEAKHSVLCHSGKSDCEVIAFVATGDKSVEDHVDNVLNGCHCSEAYSNAEADMELAKQMERFCTYDGLGIEPYDESQKMKALDAYAESEFERQVRYDRKRKCYSVGMLFHPDAKLLINNRRNAVRRFEALERKLDGSPELKERYSAAIQEYMDNDDVEECDDEGPEGKTFYLPHSAVFRDDKSTSKTRVVFNCSAKGPNGVSLNDTLLAGPKEEQDVVDVLLAFRNKKVAIQADIKRMFMQVGIHEDQRDVLRFLWRNDKFSKLKTLRFKKAIFGSKDSPFKCCKCVKYHAEKFKEKFPEVVDIILNHRYMDDVMSSEHTETDCIEMIRILREIMLEGGFDLRKWVSNSKEVMEALPEGERLAAGRTVSVTADQNTETKALGVQWDFEADVMSVGVDTAKYSNRKVTKRLIAGQVSSLFDPLTFIGPVAIVGKRILQAVWLHEKAVIASMKENGESTKQIDRKRKSLWEEPVSDEIELQFQQWQKQLERISAYKLPRCLVATNKNYVPVERRLHVFADASPVGICAVAYLRTEYANKHATVRFVMAKNKVAPAGETLPRLELAASLCGVRLSNKISKSVTTNKPSVHWLDSSVAFQWIRTDVGQLRLWVGNRVKEMLQTHTKGQFRHVPGTENPADLGTRGITVQELLDGTLWDSPMGWLAEPESEWPDRKFTLADIDAEEAKKETTAKNMQPPFSNEDSEEIMLKATTRQAARKQLEVFENPLQTLLNGFNDLRILLHVAVYFTYKTRHSGTPFVTEDRLAHVLRKFVRFEQEKAYAGEIAALQAGAQIPRSSSLARVLPVLDEEGLLRAPGRYQDEDRPPVILPRNCKLTKLLIMHTHNENQHQGTDWTMYHFKRGFWCPKARQTTMNILRKCVVCLKARKPSEGQRISTLPKFRVDEQPIPWTYTGVDFAGPMLVFDKDEPEATGKAWVAVFTCLNIRAVHLELVRDLTAETFIHVLRRFWARRGKGQVIYSDNGRTFVRTAKEVEALNKCMQSKKMQDKLHAEHIKWVFQTPASPHHGGVFERMVKAVKISLRAAIGKAKLTFEEIATLLVEAEAIINSRPLGEVSETPGEPLPVSPAMLLHGHSLLNNPFPREIEEKKSSLPQRWKHRLAAQQSFLMRFQASYLNGLREAKKWTSETHQLKVGDLCMVAEPCKRQQWPLARIEELIPGRDGLVRSVVVRMKGGLVRRPVQKIICLEEAVSEESCDKATPQSETDIQGRKDDQNRDEG